MPIYSTLGCLSETPRYALAPALHLAVICHGQPSTLDISESNTSRICRRANRHSVAHVRLARRSDDRCRLSWQKRCGADLDVVAVEEVDLAVATAGDGVVGREVGHNGAAVRNRRLRDVEGDDVVDLVGSASGLRNRVVDWEANGFRVGDRAGAGVEGGRCGGGGGGDAQQSCSEGEVLHGWVGGEGGDLLSEMCW